VITKHLHCKCLKKNFPIFEKKFGGSKKGRTFVPTFILSSGLIRSYATGFFYAFCSIYCGFVPPRGALMRPLLLSESQRERRNRFFISAPNRFFSTEMTFTEKNANGKKYSTPERTSDYESVNLPNSIIVPNDSEFKRIGHATDGDSSGIDGNILTQDANGSVAICGDANDSSVHTQSNHVQDNHGITGITGTGHTINVYQYPKELEELLLKLLTKVSL
jgi:hypothetical protein